MSSSNHSRHPHRKRWGQNFLRDAGAVRRIADAVKPAPGEVVLEIGPGEGALTDRLVELAYPLILIEIDPLLIEKLRRRYESENVEVISGDALEAPLPSSPFRAVGNLPYNVANPIIRRVLKSPLCRGGVFMVQREVAERFIATPGDPDYGYLTLVTRLYARPRIILNLGPSSFFPRPKVSSAVVAFEIVKPPITNAPELLESIISASFRQRRKKLTNNLDGWNGLSKARVESAVEEAGLESAVRAETLTLDDFDRLATLLTSQAGSA